jgi:benzoyl-CoA reductase/2-hydroxyglutaryl-CoA dehydratase subunit BcrC/BadD/HgdB
MLERLLNVPTFMADNPTIHPRYDCHRNNERWYEEHPTVGTGYKHELDESYREYVKGQLRQEIAFLEQVGGKKLDMGRLRETIALSSRGAELFLEIMDLRRNVPCPVGAQDVMPLIGPSFYWAGDPREVEIYEAARDEVKQKAENGEGAIPEERFRLFFEGIPPWYILGLFNYMAERKAVSVAETYPFEFCHVMDPDKDPLDNLADKALSYMYNCSIQERSDLTLTQVAPYRLDGAVAWSSICCKIFALFSTFLRYDLDKEFGIPTLIVDADFADPRDYNDALVKNRIDAYIELLEQRKQQEELSS